MRLWQRGVLFLSSAGGLGYLPKAPGTFGTLAAIPIWWALRNVSIELFVLAVLGIIVASVIVADLAERIYGKHDVQKIVIDEVAGLMVTAVGVPFAVWEVVAAFVLFRLFDMTKPPPIRAIDQRVKGGLGVVLDDVAAGVAASCVLHLARLAYGGWW